MSRHLVEFINTWPSCDEYGLLIKKLADLHKDSVEVKIYQAGKDFSYIKKYGVITKGTMIIDQKKKYDRLNKSVIEGIIQELVAYWGVEVCL